MPKTTNESDLKTFPSQLAQLDREIASLLSRRCELLRQWSEDSPSSIPEFQEANAISRASPGPNVDPRDHGLLDSLMSHIAGAVHHHVVRPQHVAYLGPEHSFSYAAAAKFFGKDSGLLPLPSIAAVFDEVAREQAKYGVVPIENSTDGRIVDTLTMFARTPVQICGEILLPIHHNLLARVPRDEIRNVYSKPQALSQCRGWLAQHLPDARWCEVASTTAAAKIASEEPGAAAVASIEAATQYGLDVVAKNIEDSPNNVTRFVVIGKDRPRPTGCDKTSLMFQVPHKPGALADVMVLFKQNGLNLTWIESFPIPSTPNEYLFFVELEGHSDNGPVAQAIDRLRIDALRLECLGSYPKANGTIKAAT
ncbi:MAG: prephenate dehydratase [Pirellula sp.]|jgi:chorismate mutase/prephenate dehydratase|nr:prephenate dehydratase [Pirellula sp.]